MRVLLLDNEQMLGELLAVSLSGSPDIWVLGRYRTNDPRLLEVVASWRADVIMVDLDLVGSAAVDLIRQLREAAPATRVVVLGTDSASALCVAMARAGADAWLDMTASLDDLILTIRTVYLGGAVYPAELLGNVLRSLREDARRARTGEGPLDALSVREREVLVGMMQGRTGAEIANRLFVSTNTVRTHSRNILMKLEVHSRLEAVALARAAGLRAPPADVDAESPPSNEVVALTPRRESAVAECL